MNLQHERIEQLCLDLNLQTIATEHSGLCQDAAKKNQSFYDFLENLLRLEKGNRLLRKPPDAYKNSRISCDKNI